MARAKRVRKLSPITERRRARKAAREKCRAETKRLKTWVPAERQRVAGQIKSLQAHAVQQIGQLRAQTAELVKAEREELAKRIATARKNAKMGVCVDMEAGPELRRYGPVSPHHLAERHAHKRRGGQQRMFSSAPGHSGGKLGAPFRVRGHLVANEKAALAVVLRHLKEDQGGIVVLELADGRGGYVDGPYYGLEGDGKTLRELDPLDPHGHNIGRAGKMQGYGGALREHEYLQASDRARRVAENKATSAPLLKSMRPALSPDARDHRPRWPQVAGGQLVRIQYGTERTRDGFVAVVNEDGRLSTVGRPADRDVALAGAKEWAEELAAKHSGDWDVRVEKMKSSSAPPPKRSSRPPAKRTSRKGYSTRPPSHSSAPPPAKKKKSRAAPRRPNRGAPWE